MTQICQRTQICDEIIALIQKDDNDFKNIFIKMAGTGNNDSVVYHLYKEFEIKGDFFNTIKNNNDIDTLRNYFSNALSYIDLFTRVILYSEKWLLKPNGASKHTQACFDVASIYIKILETCIIAPINMKIFELTAKESNEKADKSVKYGRWSIILGFISIVIGLLGSIYSIYSSIQNDIKIEEIYKSTKALVEKIDVADQ